MEQTTHDLFEKMDVGLSVFLQTTAKLIRRTTNTHDDSVRAELMLSPCNGKRQIIKTV